MGPLISKSATKNKAVFIGYYTDFLIYNTQVKNVLANYMQTYVKRKYIIFNALVDDSLHNRTNLANRLKNSG